MAYRGRFAKNSPGIRALRLLSNGTQATPQELAGKLHGADKDRATRIKLTYKTLQNLLVSQYVTKNVRPNTPGRKQVWEYGITRAGLEVLKVYPPDDDEDSAQAFTSESDADVERQIPDAFNATRQRVVPLHQGDKLDVPPNAASSIFALADSLRPELTPQQQIEFDARASGGARANAGHLAAKTLAELGEVTRKGLGWGKNSADQVAPDTEKSIEKVSAALDQLGITVALNSDGSMRIQQDDCTLLINQERARVFFRYTDLVRFGQSSIAP